MYLFAHWSCDHLMISNIIFIFDIYIYIYTYDVVIIFHLSLHVLFLSLFIHMFLIMYAIFYFCFTLRCLDEFCLKCFRNTDCQNLPCHELSLQSFLRVFVRIDFIVFNKWLWVEWFMTSLIFHLFVVVLSRIAKGWDC